MPVDHSAGLPRPLPPIPRATRTGRRGPAWIVHVDDEGRRWAEPRGGFPDRFDRGDRTCFYCDSNRPFANLGTFRRHILRMHGTGLAKRLGLYPLDPDEPPPEH